MASEFAGWSTLHDPSSPFLSMSHEDYKAAKEAHVSNTQGTTRAEVALITIVPVVMQCLVTRLHAGDSLLASVLFVCLPCLLAQLYPHTASLSISAAVCVLSVMSFISDRNQKSQIQDKKGGTQSNLRLNFVSVYRGCMMLHTIIAILAVDFHVFPRRLAKAETWGLGLMDVGVGGFMFSAAVVSPAALSGFKRSRQAAKSLSQQLASTVPLIVLGSARFFTVKASDYAEHVSEYGTHWNFFFTLALVQVFIVLIQPKPKWCWIVACILVALYQLLLNIWLADVIEHGHRNNFFMANREGIASSIGYLAIYLFGITIGHIMASLSVSGKRTAMVAMLLLVSLASGATAHYFTTLFGISRRLNNSPYVLWTVAYNCFALAIAACFSVDKQDKNSTDPVLALSIGANQLALFLMANLMTGAVNLSLRTLAVPELQSVVLLAFYVMLWASIAWWVHLRGLRLKVW